jgi:hypothetical protein
LPQVFLFEVAMALSLVALAAITEGYKLSGDFLFFFGCIWAVTCYTILEEQ